MDLTVASLPMTPMHPAMASALPPGWSEAVDENGRTYYQNAATQATQWGPPAWPTSHPTSSTALPPGWSEAVDDDTTDPLFPTSCLECHALCAPGAAFCPECEFETTHNKPINPATFNPPLEIEPPNPCRDRHWMVTGTTLGLCAWAVCAFFATIEDSDDACTTFETLFSTGYCASFSTGYCTWIIFAVLYANHFAEARISGTRKFIANISDPRQSEDFLQKLTQAPPDMVWVSENYHTTYESREKERRKVVTSIVRAKVCVGLSEGQGERDGRAFLHAYASYRHNLSTHMHVYCNCV